MPADTDLHKAARDGDMDEVQALLKDGNDINAAGAQGRTALHRALGGGYAELAAFMIEKGADPGVVDILKRTSLHWAAMGPPPGNLACCQLMFDKADGASMLAKTTKSGSTPLHSAASTNRHEVIALLIEKGADQAAVDDDGLTPYASAKQSGHTEVLAVLQPPKGSGGGGGGGGCCILM